MSSTTSNRSTISRDFDRTPSPRFFQRVDQSEEYGVYDILASPAPDFLQRIDEDSLSSASRLTDSIADFHPVRRTLIFSEDGKSVASMSRRFPRHLFPAIAASRGVGVEVQLTDAQVRRQAELDALVNSRVSVASPTVVVDSDYATTVKRSSKRSRFLEEEFGRMMKRRCTNVIIQCASCCGQHLVDASGSSRSCVFCGHSELDEVDCDVAECIDDC
jgi:hypothetical protein